MRARIVYASKERVKQDAITYEELADPKWKGKICIRSGQYIYNTALFAAYIAHHGEAATEQWLKGVKANLAQKPSGGDREVARDIAAGKCDIGVANTYYWALMLNSEADRKPWAEATKVILATFKGNGTHVNLSGVILAKHAPNKANAIKFMEFLVGDKAQHLYADQNYEYPIRAGVPINATIAAYGALKADPTSIAKIANNRKAAATLVDKVGFDNCRPRPVGALRCGCREHRRRSEDCAAATFAAAPGPASPARRAPRGSGDHRCRLRAGDGAADQPCSHCAAGRSGNLVSPCRLCAAGGAAGNRPAPFRRGGRHLGRRHRHGLARHRLPISRS
jgi:ABC-type Fe3+ transport system substrate-binding protein